MSGGAGVAPATRLVVLGASNVQLGLATILSTARTLAGGPIDLLAALGHGRSYGRPSSIPGRSLPSVLECRLWQDLAARPPVRTHSLVTDIGNDLLYGRPPQRVAAWVAECVDRLTDAGPVTLTSLPLDNLPTLGEWRYRAFRTLLFPGLRLSLSELASVAHELNDRLAELAADRACRIIPLPSTWYGIDPIHFRPRAWCVAWTTLLNSAMAGEKNPSFESGANASVGKRLSVREHVRLYASAAAERTLLGARRQTRQPCFTMCDGSRASLY